MCNNIIFSLKIKLLLVAYVLFKTIIICTETFVLCNTYDVKNIINLSQLTGIILCNLNTYPDITHICI